MGGIGSGGPRDGAGRKTDDGQRRSRMTVTLPGWLALLVREESEARKVPASQLVTELLIKGIES